MWAGEAFRFRGMIHLSESRPSPSVDQAGPVSALAQVSTAYLDCHSAASEPSQRRVPVVGSRSRIQRSGLGIEFHPAVSMGFGLGHCASCRCFESGIR
jgi:hypothetical protein